MNESEAREQAEQPLVKSLTKIAGIAQFLKDEVQTARKIEICDLSTAVALINISTWVDQLIKSIEDPVIIQAIGEVREVEISMRIGAAYVIEDDDDDWSSSE